MLRALVYTAVEMVMIIVGIYMIVILRWALVSAFSALAVALGIANPQLWAEYASVFIAGGSLVATIAIVAAVSQSAKAQKEGEENE